MGRTQTVQTRNKISQSKKGQCLGNQHARRYPEIPGSVEAIARAKAFKSDYYIRNKESILAKAKARRSAPGYREHMDPIKRRSMLKSRYGIDHNIYLELLAKQHGGCAICGSTYPGTSRSKYFDVDHNHTTGQVRGLLCRDCNVTTGVVENKWDKIQLIRQYLAEWNAVEFDVKEKQVPETPHAARGAGPP